MNSTAEDRISKRLAKLRSEIRDMVEAAHADRRDYELADGVVGALRLAESQLSAAMQCRHMTMLHRARQLREDIEEARMLAHESEEFGRELFREAGRQP